MQENCEASNLRELGGVRASCDPTHGKNLKNRLDGSIFARVKIVVINDPGER